MAGQNTSRRFSISLRRRAGTRQAWQEPGALAAIAAVGRFAAACRKLDGAKGHALIVFYRSFMTAGDTAPVGALADALAARWLEVTAIFVTSLKDADAAAWVCAELAREKPDVIINTTGFSARLGTEGSVLDGSDAPVLQAIFSSATEAREWRETRTRPWRRRSRHECGSPGNGRAFDYTRAIACKAETGHRADLEFTPRIHAPLPSRVRFVADLAAAWVRLRKTPRAARKIACVLSDYPNRQGRGGYAVGLDTAKSIASIALAMRDAGYSIGPLPRADELMRGLEEGFLIGTPHTRRLCLGSWCHAPGIRRIDAVAMG